MWMTVASTAFSIFSGMSNAKAQKKLSKANRDNAVLSQTYENRGINARLRQEEEVMHAKKREVLQAAMEAQSASQARGRNVGGHAAERTSRLVMNKLGRSISNANRNVQGYRAQTEADKKSTTATAQSRINSMPYKKYNPMMDLISGGLQIMGGKAKFDAQQKSLGNANPTWGQYATYGWDF